MDFKNTKNQLDMIEMPKIKAYTKLKVLVRKEDEISTNKFVIFVFYEFSE